MESIPVKPCKDLAAALDFPTDKKVFSINFSFFQVLVASSKFNFSVAKIWYQQKDNIDNYIDNKSILIADISQTFYYSKTDGKAPAKGPRSMTLLFENASGYEHMNIWMLYECNTFYSHQCVNPALTWSICREI